jgi:hypothetical protein
MFPLLKKTDAILSRIFAILLAMSSNPKILADIDSVGLTRLFHDVQYLLQRALSARPHNVGRSQDLENYYWQLRSVGERLEVSHAHVFNA